MGTGNRIVISDDLTGAMDAGVGLLSKGLSANVVCDLRSLKSFSPEELAILDTESRNIPGKSAYDRITGSMDAIREAGSHLVYKKVDSTLRGNLGTELEAIHDLKPDLLFAFAPALPYSGRQTMKGCQYLNGRPLTESDISKDPFSSVDSSYIPELLARQTKIPCGVVQIEDIRRGPVHVSQCIRRCYGCGIRIAVFDIVSDEDFDIALSGLELSGTPNLPCGSAGLFPHIFRKNAGNGGEKSCFRKSGDPALVVSGSPAAAAKRQIQTAAGQGTECIAIDIRRVLTDMRTCRTEYSRVLQLAFRCLSAGKSVILDGAGKSKEQIRAFAKDDAVNLDRDGQKIRNFLSALAGRIVEKNAVSGLMVIGGDTAMKIFSGMGACGIHITGSAEPYVPAGRLLGGKFNGIPVITKAGGFGSDFVIAHGIQYLKGCPESSKIKVSTTGKD